jgi:hypothetical protein
MHGDFLCILLFRVVNCSAGILYCSAVALLWMALLFHLYGSSAAEKAILVGSTSAAGS